MMDADPENDSLVILRYPTKTFAKDCVEITNSDIRTLDPTNYLNDTIVTFYLRYIKHEVCGRDIEDKVHVFSSFFYEKLKKFWLLDSGKNSPKQTLDGDLISVGDMIFQAIRKWYRKVNIFKKDFLVIPVCENNHWSLIIVCYPNHAPTLSITEPSSHSDNGGLFETDMNEKFLYPSNKKKPSILVMDSLMSRRSDFTFPVRYWLDHEWLTHCQSFDDYPIKLFDTESLIEIWPNLPQQNNLYDCGVYIAAYCHYFLRTPARTYDLILKSRNENSNNNSEIYENVGRLLQSLTRDEIRRIVVSRAGAN